MLHSLIRMTLYMYLTYMQGFVNPKDARKVYILQNSCMNWSKLLEVELFVLLVKFYEKL